MGCTDQAHDKCLKIQKHKNIYKLLINKFFVSMFFFRYEFIVTK